MAGEIMLRKPRPELKVMLRHLAAEDGVSIERLMERVLWEWSEPRFRQAGFAVREGRVVPLGDVTQPVDGKRPMLVVDHGDRDVHNNEVSNLTLREQLEGSLEGEKG